MDLLKILYQDYVIIIVISIIITVISYFIIKNNNNNDDENEEKPNYSKTLLIVFVSTILILFGLKYLISYMNKNNYFQKGGESYDLKEKLTIVADDLDYDIMEN